ncbi:peptidase inhibitor family I36 protein [Streptomyces sp. NBC_00536]|uniref:peptidase inhibitor family I36 protein n=1 Tax=Streptomyces sp. NBC_00536 TaxID=2975769 RepID=UPI002E805DAD|nr:peptidase inhibitor family I36 protein [Streptomyces sp. NBC_00536]WUC77569.1 peptidase inhibitor family I36 protein [Streptomyces sp. NBC_00536]
MITSLTRACAALALAALPLLSPTSAAAAPAAAAPCPSGSVCFYTAADYGGQSWEWSPRSGYRDMPPQFHDHVGSFVANVDACFIDWQPKATRQVRSGDWRRSYLGDFGGRIDAVNGGNC